MEYRAHGTAMRLEIVDQGVGLDLCMELGVRGRKIKLYSAKAWDKAESVPTTLVGARGPSLAEETADLSKATRGTPTWFQTVGTP